jgi:PAS domain S-box/diguanylate cyclase (GGDEF) domain
MKNNHIADFILSHRNSVDLVMDLVPIPLFMKNRAGLYIDCNQAFTKFFNLGREDIIGKSVFDIWSIKEANVFYTQDEELFRQGGTQIYETTITSSTGTKNVVQFHKQVFTDASGEIAGFLGVIFDITEKKKLEETLAKQAIMDQLTGLSNRWDGMAKLETLHILSERQKQFYCVAMCDLDHFKGVNDQYGHQNGDCVLKEFAICLRNTLRCNDICFRYGGEEFVILLPETSISTGHALLERLRKAWAEKIITLSINQKLSSTVSIGISQYKLDDSSFTQLLKESDEALYQAKNKGRNCCVYYKNGKETANEGKVNGSDLNQTLRVC